MPAGPENSTAGFTTVYPPTQPTKVPCNPETPEDGWIKNPNDPDQKFCYYIGNNAGTRQGPLAETEIFSGFLLILEDLKFQQLSIFVTLEICRNSRHI